ncbi:MAG: hypothetical protein EP338_01990 [Bacteroidetes bacterium]|nr:MAG: hypothetical protein EP338_01990 [Bacteroidota bacterium]
MMKRLVFFALLALSLFSCEFKDVDFEGVDHFKVKEFSKKEAMVNMGLKIRNDNGFKLKIKPSTLNVFLEDMQVGTIHLEDKLVIKKKSTQVYPTDFKIKFADGFLMKAMRLMRKEKLQLRMEGTVKGGAFGVSKKFPVKERRTIDREQLKLFNFK